MTPDPEAELNQDEEAFGFVPRQTPTGIFAHVANLPDGLHAIRRQSSDGTVHYDVCDDALRPLYRPARSLDELRQRFPRGSKL